MVWDWRANTPAVQHAGVAIAKALMKLKLP